MASTAGHRRAAAAAGSVHGESRRRGEKISLSLCVRAFYDFLNYFFTKSLTVNLTIKTTIRRVHSQVTRSNFGSVQTRMVFIGCADVSRANHQLIIRFNPRTAVLS